MSTSEVQVIETVKKFRCFFPLGLPTVLLSFAKAVAGIVLTDLIVYRTCLVSLNNNSTECPLLRTNTTSQEAADLEAKIEPHASMIVMTNSLIETILPAVLSLFLGAWSDRNGRKPLLLAAFGGYALQYSTLALLCDWNISPWFLLVASIPVNIVGGLCTGILASICYISDTTTAKDRMVHLTLWQAMIFGGDFLGTLTGPLIFGNHSYTNVFVTAAMCCFSALLFTYFCIPETVKSASKESLRGLFRLSLVKELFVSSFSKRDGFHRSIVWLGILTFALFAMISKGHLTIGFLFTRVRLGWKVPDYSYLYAVDNVIRIVGLSAISLLGHVSGLSDTMLAGLALVSALSGAVAKSLVWRSWHMYLSVCIAIFSGGVQPVMRSIISKSVPAQDVGKVFSLSAFLEAASPLAGAPLYTLIYSNYLPPIYYPSPVYLFSSSLYALLILCVICISFMARKASRLAANYSPAAQLDDGR